MFKIMPFFPKLLSCPVFVHLAQFSYIYKITFFHENNRRKLTCQLLCCMLIVFSLRFVNRSRFSDQCFGVQSKWLFGGWMFNRSFSVDFLISHFWAVFLTLNLSSRTWFTALAKVVDQLLFRVLQLLRKGLYKIRRFTSVSAYAFRIANAFLPFPLTFAFLSYFCKCLLESQRSEKNR